MVISVSNTFKHEAACAKKTNYGQEELKGLVLQSIEKMGIDPSAVHWNENDQLEIKGPNSLKLHSFMLEMEELGLDLKMTKQTLIEIN